MVKINVKVASRVEITLEKGMIFQHENGERFMLTCVDKDYDGVALYSLIGFTGYNRWCNPTYLDDVAEQIDDSFSYVGKFDEIYGVRTN